MATRTTRNRSQGQAKQEKLQNQPIGGNKRPLEDAQEGNQKKKRVFGDITNRENNGALAQKKGIQIGTTTKKGKTKTIVAVPKAKKVQKSSENELPLSQNSVKSDDLSWDILELSQESKGSQSSNSSINESSEFNFVVSEDARQYLKNCSEPVDDIDKDNKKDPFQVGEYASFIFNYYKERELLFTIDDYMKWQKDITTHMRGILVDWLVEVQENFELNHETLYLAIKLVDLYLSKKKTSKEKLQLIGATAMFIACKFDERCPPVLDDFLYICDDAYDKHELLEMERIIFRTIEFDIGIPLSYRFLRRYAKCAKADLNTLTLARYILESSQMYYNYINSLDSHRAAACLLLAMKMDKSGPWTSTLVHYSGYTEGELLPLAKELNAMVATAHLSKFSTIRVKYSHVVFREVAKIPALDSPSFTSLSTKKSTTDKDQSRSEVDENLAAS